jgi:hypothetical protein
MWGGRRGQRAFCTTCADKKGRASAGYEASRSGLVLGCIPNVPLSQGSQKKVEGGMVHRPVHTLQFTAQRALVCPRCLSPSVRPRRMGKKGLYPME